MALYLTVTSGADEGKSFRVDAGECLIGRSPSSTIVLRDESVAWEHVMVRVDGGRATLQNLSALGTRVKGRRVSDEVRLGNNDEIELSEDCRVVIQQRIGRVAVRGRSRLLLPALAVALVIVILGGVVYVALQPSEPPPRPVTERHWRQAYRRIEDRMDQWTKRGEFPEPGLAIYREAWGLEQAVNYLAAAAAWQRLRSLLLTVQLPGPNPENRTIAESPVASQQKALAVIMGWDLDTSTGGYQWDTDKAYADALTRFVKRRVEINRDRAEG
jgi:hypothetical protein